MNVHQSMMKFVQYRRGFTRTNWVAVHSVGRIQEIRKKEMNRMLDIVCYSKNCKYHEQEFHRVSTRGYCGYDGRMVIGEDGKCEYWNEDKKEEVWMMLPDKEEYNGLEESRTCEYWLSHHWANGYCRIVEDKSNGVECHYSKQSRFEDCPIYRAYQEGLNDDK